jgi:hypothetical protein
MNSEPVKEGLFNRGLIKRIKGAPRHPLLKPKIMKKQMDYFFNLKLIRIS